MSIKIDIVKKKSSTEKSQLLVTSYQYYSYTDTWYEKKEVIHREWGQERKKKQKMGRKKKERGNRF